MPEATFNRVTVLGRLTRDPEIRSLDGGDQVSPPYLLPRLTPGRTAPASRKNAASSIPS